MLSLRAFSGHQTQRFCRLFLRAVSAVATAEEHVFKVENDRFLLWGKFNPATHDATRVSDGTQKSYAMNRGNGNSQQADA
jgi:hypothetical protein